MYILGFVVYHYIPSLLKDVKHKETICATTSTSFYIVHPKMYESKKYIVFLSLIRNLNMSIIHKFIYIYVEFKVHFNHRV